MASSNYLPILYPPRSNACWCRNSFPGRLSFHARHQWLGFQNTPATKAPRGTMANPLASMFLLPAPVKVSAEAASEVVLPGA